MSILKKFASNENNAIILKNTVGAFLVKGGALVISLFTMPAYMRYFEDQQTLGLWFTILSVLSWVLTFDLGIGNGLRNHLVRVLVNKDYRQAKQYISSAYVSIGAVVLCAIVAANILFPFFDWNAVFNVGTDAVSRETLLYTVRVVFTGIMLQFLLKLITSILYAMQRSALNNLLTLISSILTLLYVLLAKSSSTADNLIHMAYANVLAVNIPLLVASVVVFTTRMKKCRPRIRCCNKKCIAAVMKLGGVFFWVQIVFMLINNTNEFLISWLTQPDKVVEFQVYNKLFTLIGTVFTLALTPIWSAVTKAISERQFSWVRKLYRMLRLLALLAVVCEFAMIPFLQIIVNIWLQGKAIQVNYLYAMAFAAMGSMMIWNGVLSSIANGLGKPKGQALFLTIGVIIKFPMAWLLVRLTGSWISVVVANILAMVLYCVIQPLWISRYLKKREVRSNQYVQE
jgi:O-antigen/teichoic acid export membrane protein